MVKRLPVQLFAKMPNQYVNTMIHRSHSLSLIEEKLLCMLVNIMQKKNEAKKKTDYHDYDYEQVITGELSVNEFKEFMGIGADNNKQVIEAIRDLITFAIEIDTPTTRANMTVFSWFITDKAPNIIHYRFNEYFAGAFTIGLGSNFFKLSLAEITSFTSIYGIKIYQLLKSRFNMERKEHIFTIKELYKYFNVGDKYSRYNDFKRKIIDIAMVQINNNIASEFGVDFEEIKEGLKVVAIKFLIKPKGHNYYDLKNRIPPSKEKIINNSLTIWLSSKNSVIQNSAKMINNFLKKDRSWSAIRNYYTLINEQIKIDKLRNKNTRITE